MLRQSSDFAGAAQLLVKMLTSGLAPRRYWAALLLDAVPLLEGSQLVLSTEDTYTLLRCLQEITSSHAKNEYV